MIERLKAELYRYLTSDEYMNTREDGVTLIAQHFYNLALGDMKAKLKVVVDHYNNDPRYDGGCALDELYDFIDKLIKQL